MRYRIETYDVSINGTSVVLTLPVPDVPWAKIEDWDDIDQDEKITQYITESLRLIVDETAGVVFCSSMQKANIVQAGITQQSGVTKHISIEFTIPTGKTIASTDQFTVEFDWGDLPSGLSGGSDPNSAALAAFFNITPPVPNAVPMTQQEVEDDLNELWNLIITQ